MKTMTLTEFKKGLKKAGKETLQEYKVNPYFNLESWSAKTVYISDQVTEVTMLTYRKKIIAVVFPDKGSVKDSLQPYFEELQRITRVVAPVISVFDVKGKKLAQLEEAQAFVTA